MEILSAAAESKGAEDIVILDIRKVSSISEYLIICSADNSPQLRAIQNAIDEKISDIKGTKWEGTADSGWVLLDLGGIVVHVLGNAARKFYKLEDLWGKEAVVYHY